MKNNYMYYHNPRCSKSRQGIELLNKEKVSFVIKEYLKEPLTKKELKDLFKKIADAPNLIIRKKEKVYKELNLGSKSLNTNDWIDLIIENPILLERPILSNDKKAIIGRPPEEMLKII